MKITKSLLKKIISEQLKEDKFSEWWDKQNSAIKTKILNKAFSSHDVRIYKMASKSLSALSLEGWGIDYLESKAKQMGLYK